MKKATHEVRKQQSNIVAVVQQGLESMRVVKAFGRQDLEQEELGEVSRATVDAALKARRVKALLSPMMAVIVSFCTAFVLWRGSLLILAGDHDSGSADCFSLLPDQVLQTGERPRDHHESIAQTAVGVERVRGILDADIIIPEIPTRGRSAAFRGEIEFEDVAFAYDSDAPVLSASSFDDQAGPDGGNCRGHGWGQVHYRQPDSAVL